MKATPAVIRQPEVAGHPPGAEVRSFIPPRPARRRIRHLFLALGAVALLAGAVGVANIMIISVLERRQEIGLRRALGATRGQIRVQFLSEAIVLGLLGGVAGVIAGAVSTAVYAHVKSWPTVIPAEAWAGGLAAALLIGTVAGLLPAICAARLSPTQPSGPCDRPMAAALAAPSPPDHPPERTKPPGKHANVTGLNRRGFLTAPAAAAAGLGAGLSTTGTAAASTAPGSPPSATPTQARTPSTGSSSVMRRSTTPTCAWSGATAHGDYWIRNAVGTSGDPRSGVMARWSTATGSAVSAAHRRV